MTAQEKIRIKTSNKKHICVGLDTDAKKIPEFLQNETDGVYRFNQEIIEATFRNAAAYKINFAFYEEAGERGFKNLERTINLIKSIDSTLPIIADAKRGDIGNTSTMYAKSLFEYFDVDCSTLHPYMGEDSLRPFLDYGDKVHFVLGLTSNSGSKDFEKIKIETGEFLYQLVIRKISEWNSNKNCGVVFGATNPLELTENIELLTGLFVLLPGVGAQGGDLKTIVKTFNGAGHTDFLVNVSRTVLYASNKEDFAKAANDEVISLNEQVLLNL